ncbi:coproporphyrinogen III oxidase [Nonlabens ulvanivorans]|nr:oxygen-independent coproporphyrinogen III oxidase [Nonlabens ulvanivorans]GAK93389.1 coproporphyrinogen III oxidase [Nonlabens ulvanivorans]
MSSLVQKYNVAGPRYTSYPTVPYWEENSFTKSDWESSVIKSIKESNQKEGISLYIHLPFCEAMCTFCGCNKRITVNHNVELPYITHVLKEWSLYLALLDETPIISELHLGGGTPTFFSPENLKVLIDGIFRNAHKSKNAALSFEGHPNNTTKEHLKTLFELGFNRVSYGVQDYNLEVQKAIHRVQPFENVLNATLNAREIGYTSVGHDLIYGLPFQKEEHVIHTIKQTIALKPDRIAFYSYAFVPWIKGNGQRGFSQDDLPSPDEKRAQYEIGKKMLEDAGYIEIGMDHFALASDELNIAMETKKLHRNFMGYSSSSTQAMIGLGVSSISDSWYGFSQNVKSITEYKKLLDQDQIPVYRGHLLNNEDLIIRKHILNLMCHFETQWEKNGELYIEEIPDILISLKEMEEDGLLILESNGITVTEKGRPFVRNICMAFDLRLISKKPNTQLFSMTI